MADQIIHGRLFDELRRLFPSSCTIRFDSDSGQTASGHPREAWEDLPEHTDIPCALGPPGGGTARPGQEIRRPDSTVATATHRIVLKGYYPEITNEMRAMVDGKEFNILHAGADSRKAASFLDVELVR